MPWVASGTTSQTTFVASTATAYGWQQLSSFSSGGGDLVALGLFVDDCNPMKVVDTHPVYLME